MDKEECMHKFYEMFKRDEKDIHIKFLDCFSEFIAILNDVDLSDKTKKWLIDIFIKDTNMFFKS